MAIIEQLVDKNHRNNDLSDHNNTTAIFNTKLEEISTQKHFKTNLVSKSYSSAVKIVSNRSADVLHDNKQIQKHAVLVTPNDNNALDSSKQNEKTVKQLVNNHNNSSKKPINVNSVKYSAKGGLVLNCVTEEDSTDLISVLTSKAKALTAKVAIKRWPKIKVMAVEEEISEDLIIEELVEKNPEIGAFFQNNQLLNIEDNIKTKFKFRRQEKTGSNTWVLELNPKIFKIIVNKGKVFVGWHSCKVEVYQYIKRCYHCQRFGHTNHDCRDKDNKPFCGICAGDQNTTSCGNKSETNCVNCQRNNNLNPSKRRLDSNHTVFSKECQCLRKVDQMITESTDYD